MGNILLIGILKKDVFFNKIY